MKNWKEKVDRASKMEYLGNLGRKQRRFVAAITRKIIDTKIVEKSLPKEALEV